MVLVRTGTFEKRVVLPLDACQVTVASEMSRGALAGGPEVIENISLLVSPANIVKSMGGSSAGVGSGRPGAGRGHDGPGQPDFRVDGPGQPDDPDHGGGVGADVPARRDGPGDGRDVGGRAPEQGRDDEGVGFREGVR